MSKNQKPILITGGFGYVGSCLTAHLLEHGYKVRVIDLMLYGDSGLQALNKQFSPQLLQEHFSFVQGDIRDPKTVEKAMAGVECIIHLAAISNDPTGEVDETLTRQVNFDAVGLLISLAKKAGVSRFINASSSSVFGIQETAAITEELEPKPLTYYSKYKMLAEWIVVGANQPGFCTVNIRPATICGVSPRQRFDLTVNKLTADGVMKKKITVHGGEQRRPNVGITDMVNLYRFLIDCEAWKIEGKTFNFGFENHKIIDIARIIEQELQDLNVSISITDTLDKRDYHIAADKITKDLGYKPVSSICTEVKNLRKALEAGQFPNIDDKQYYNMQVMSLDRSPSPYQYLGA